MKYAVILFSIWISLDSNSAAQDNQYLRIKAGDKGIPVKDQYVYPEFLPGKILLTNGGSLTAKLNYNLVLSEMHFVHSKGDTLALEDNPTIWAVAVGQDAFYYEYPKQYWMLLTDYDTGKLMIRRAMILIDREKEGGYGQSTGTSSIRNTTSLSSGNSSVARLNNHADLLFSRKNEYRLMDKNYRFYQANQSGFLTLFSKNKSVIKEYVRENKINFTQEEDLKKLLQFCTQLP